MSKFTDALQTVQNFIQSAAGGGKEEFAGQPGGLAAESGQTGQQPAEPAQQPAEPAQQTPVKQQSPSFDQFVQQRQQPLQPSVQRQATFADTAANAAAAAGLNVKAEPEAKAQESAQPANRMQQMMSSMGKADQAFADAVRSGDMGKAVSINEVITGPADNASAAESQPIVQPSNAAPPKPTGPTGEESLNAEISVQTAKEEAAAAEDTSERVIDREFAESAVMSAGRRVMPQRTKGLSRLNRTFTAAKKRYIDNVGRIFAKMNKNKGMALNGVLYADRELDPYCVSIGLDMAVDSLLDPESGLIELVSTKTMASFSYMRTVDEYLASPELLMQDINKVDIEVTVEKSPVNVRNSVQVRTLRVHHGGGVGLHPTQAGAYNADFDADDVTVNLDQANLRHYNRAMDYLLDIEGLPAVDMDFFPIDPPADGTTFEEMRETMLDWYFKMNADGTPPLPGVTQKDLESMASAVARAYYDLCQQSIKVDEAIGSSAKDAAEEEYQRRVIELFKRIDYVAGKFSNKNIGRYRNTVTSYIFKELFDFSCVRRALSVRMQVEDIVGADVFLEQSPDQEPLVEALVDYVNQIVAGHAAYNTVEFAEFMNRQMGTSVPKEGRNVPFRLVADFCKAIHRTDLIMIGDPAYGVTGLKGYGPKDPVPFDVLYGLTCAAAETKMLANRVYFGSHELSASRQTRERVLRELMDDPRFAATKGLPNYVGKNTQAQRDEAFREWVKAFVASYNANVRLLNMSQIEFRNGMTISGRKIAYKDKAPIYDGIKNIETDLAKPLVEVFGDKTMGALLGYDYTKMGYSRDESTEKELWIGYRDMPIRVFVQKNRMKFTGKTGKNKIREHIASGKLGVRDAVMLLADRRTVQIGHFRKQWEEATEENAGLLQTLAKHRNSRDFNKYLEEVLNIFHIMSADMFSFFGIDSVATFLASPHGRKLVSYGANNNLDGLRGELVSMIVEMRLYRSSKIIESIRDSENSTAQCTAENVEAKRIVLEKEYQKLSEGSFAWAAIIKDIQAGAEASTFRKLIEIKGKLAETKESRKIGGVGKLHAAEFWADADSEKYGNILAFLKSDVGYKTKMAVLADIVRINEGMRDFEPSHMIGLLACDPDNVRDDTSYDLDIGVKRQLQEAKASVDKISSYRNKLPDEIGEEARSFVEIARADTVKFSGWLDRMANEQGYAVYLSQKIAGDAIASVFEKNMHDSEKIQQQAQVNGLFENVSIQINGGFFTHLQQADNKVVNVVGYNQVTFMDLIQILGNPDVRLYIYDEFGTMMKEPLSRRTLCGGNDVSDVIDYLEANPRMACVLSRYMSGVDASASGKAVLQRMPYSSEPERMAGKELSSRVWSLVTDRYRFYALCAIIADPAGAVGRNMSETMAKSIDLVCNNLIEFAARSKMEAVDAGAFLEKNLGISEQIILDQLMSNKIDGIGYTEKDVEAFEEDAANIYKMASTEFVEVVKLIEESGLVDGTEAEMKAKAEFAAMDREELEKELSPKVSRLSIRASLDVLQQLGGSRTEKMIDIEGAETKRNLALKIWAREHVDNYGMVVDPRDGSKHVENYSLMGGTREDGTLTRGFSNQLSSIAKFLEVKREKGAETYNAKIKKYGDDGTNSIVKFRKYDKESLKAGEDLRASIEAAESREEAVGFLAVALIKADIELGYTDIGSAFTMSDYWNRADVMLGENSDPETAGSKYAIRTLEQISAALSSRLPDDVVFAEWNDSDGAQKVKAEQIAALDKIVRDLGTDRDPLYRSDSSIAYNCLIDLPIMGTTGNILRADRAIRARSSSVERNYTLLWRLFRRYAKEVSGKSRFHIPPREAIQARSVAVMNGSKILDGAVSLEGIGYPKNIVDKNGKVEPGYDFSRTYDLIGASDFVPDVEQFVPGPQSLVVFESDPNENIALYRKCRKYGVTICFLHKPSDAGLSKEDRCEMDLIQTQTQDGQVWILPSFDMLLNGSISKPVAPAPGQYRANPNNYVASVKDTTGEFGPADAGYTATRELIDRAKFFFGSLTGHGKAEKFQVKDLFKATMALYGARDYSLSFASKEDVRRDIINGNASVDLGVLGSDATAYAVAKRKYDMLSKEYEKRFETDADEENSILSGVCRHNSIVGYAKIEWVSEGFTNRVYAPIIPFPPTSRERRPNHFECLNPAYQPDEGSFSLDWQYSGSIANQIIKIFEGIGASNKFMVGRNLARSRTLKNGLAIDGFYYHKAVASRLFASNERIHTMISLWTIAKTDPQFAYNFASLPDAFPDNPDLKLALASNSLTREDWKNIVDTGTYNGKPLGRYYPVDSEKGAKIDAFVRHLVNKAVGFGTVNPSILLCSRTYEEDGTGELLPVWMTDFDAFLDSSYAFEEAFLAFFNLMNPNLCPDSILGDASACLFKPEIRSDGANDPYGALLCLVPHWLPNESEPYDALEAVFISPSFFGEEFTDITKVSTNAKNRQIQSLNVATSVSPREQSLLLEAARSGQSSVPPALMVTMAEDSLNKAAADVEELFPKMLDGLDHTVVAPIDGPASKVHEPILERKYGGKIVAVTGHRPKQLWGYVKNDPTLLSNKMYKAVYDDFMRYCKENNVDVVISGMALGMDQIAAQVAIDMKAEGYDIKLVCAVPCYGQESQWPDKTQEYYRDILSQADDIYVIRDGGYTARKMQDRNEWMVDNSTEVYALYNGADSGGTANCMKYVKERGRKAHVVSPSGMLVAAAKTEPKNEPESESPGGAPAKGSSMIESIDTSKDGEDFVNVYSHGTPLGQFLSNFEKTPLELIVPQIGQHGRRIKFESLESYWHALKVSEKCPESEIAKLAGMDGWKARKYGRELRSKYGESDVPFEHWMNEAVDKKLITYYKKWVEDPNAKLPLMHYYVRKDGTASDASQGIEWWLSHMRDQMDYILESYEEYKQSEQKDS